MANKAQKSATRLALGLRAAAQLFYSEHLFTIGLILALHNFASYHQSVKLKEIAFHPSDTSLFLQIPLSSCVQQMEQVQSPVSCSTKRY